MELQLDLYCFIIFNLQCFIANILIKLRFKIESPTITLSHIISFFFWIFSEFSLFCILKIQIIFFNLCISHIFYAFRVLCVDKIGVYLDENMH